MILVRAATLYFVLVFAGGFALGTIRVLWVVPRVGPRTAELLEIPLMVAVSAVAAAWTNHRFGASPAGRLGLGLLALGEMLVAERLVAIGLRGVSAADALIVRDPVSGAAYCAALVVFAGLPWLLGECRR